MAGKSKFQISRLLDERIKRIVGDPKGVESELSANSFAYILGFNSVHVTNYVGLAANFKSHYTVLPTVGLVFFKSVPNDEQIKNTLSSVKEYSDSPYGLGTCKSDKNENLFLIYTLDKDSNQLNRKIYDLSTGSYLAEQPKLNVLDESKIYNHSALSKLSLNLKLGISDDKLTLSIDEIKDLFSLDSKDSTIYLEHSNYSSNAIAGNSDLTESLYNHLDVPDDVLQAGDYLPQLNKNEKAKLAEKWRNKVKAERAPLQLRLEHEKLSYDSADAIPDGYYGLQLEYYIHLQANDPLYKTFRAILSLIRKQLELFRLILTNYNKPLEADEIKCATFSLPGHMIHTLYPIPSVAIPNYDYLTTLRKELHQVFLVPLDRPNFRYSQRVMNAELVSADELAGKFCNVHTSIIDKSGVKDGLRSVLEGKYTYHHYMQDRISDSGWGCAYRSLQTIISWFKHQGYIYSPDIRLRGPAKEDKTSPLREKLHRESRVPNHEEIQSVLVDVGDKQPAFIGSQKWIGSQEVCYVLSHLYNLDSKFISVSSGSELVYKARELGTHFSYISTPIMIGGGVLAHTIIGIDFNEKDGDASYLILDPHYTGPEDLATIIKKGWCGWKKNTFWDNNAFYNLCLPQRPNEF